MTDVVAATRASLKGRVDEKGLLHSHGEGAVAVSVGRQSLTRALALLREILLAARAAGGEIRTSAPSQGYASGRRQAGAALIFDGFAFSFSISEDTERIPDAPTRAELAQKARSAWTPIPDWDYRPAGRLAVRLEPSAGQGGRATRHRFADGVTARVEAKVPALIYELLARASAAAAQRRENERLDALYAAERAEAVARARHRYLEDLRASHARGQVERWSEARLLRDFVAAVRGRARADQEKQWLAWVGRHADRLDPPDRCPTGPDLPDEVSPYQLTQYLRDWPEHRPWRWAPRGGDGLRASSGR